MKVDLQVSPANSSWPAVRDAVLRAEADGYDTTWVFDHLDGALLGGGPDMMECCTLLGALAAVTSTIGLGTLVANVANRHPAVLAMAMSSAHRISGGRLIVGLGAGTAPGSPWATEHDLLGITLRASLADRHAALADQVTLMRSMWGATPDSPYRNFALPLPHPRIIIGANSVALARLTGRIADGLNVRLDHPRAADIVAAALDAAEGRPFEVSAWTKDRGPAGRAAAEELGCDRLVLVELGTPQ